MALNEKRQRFPDRRCPAVSGCPPEAPGKACHNPAAMSGSLDISRRLFRRERSEEGKIVLLFRDCESVGY